MKIFILLILIFVSCTSNSLLSTRGLSPQEREFYIIQNGWGISREIKEKLKDGKPCIGMKREHIFMLYGAPDHMYDIYNEITGETEKIIWSYYEINNRKLTTILKLKFDINKTLENIMVIKEDRL